MSQLDTELREQPQAIQRLLDRELGRVDDLAAAFDADDIASVVIAARGSSDNAARYAQYLFGLRNRLPVALATPSLLTIYDTAPRFDHALVVGVSQSGQSPDIVSVVAAASAQGRPTVAVTNNPDSPLANAAAITLPLHAGEERSVAATKTYTTSLVALALLSMALGPGEDRSGSREELQALPDTMADVIADVTPRDGIVDPLLHIDHCFVVGRGLNYSTAFEVALKLKELTGVLAEPYSPPDLLHGPIAALTHASPVLLLAPHEPSSTSIRDLIDPVRERGAQLIVVSADLAILDAADVAVPLCREPAPWLTPIVAVVPGQVLAARLVVARGGDPDRPPGLQKVTRTR